jgi:hypothetical protein
MPEGRTNEEEARLVAVEKPIEPTFDRQGKSHGGEDRNWPEFTAVAI